MSLVDLRQEQRAAWEARPLLRRLYRGWFAELAGRRSAVDGPTIELGSGIGSFAEAVASVVTTDVEPTQWAAHVVDAEAMPFADASVANLVLVDVYHHLVSPARFLDEAVRVLAPKGRILLLDPYCSPVSTVAYRRFHHERTDLGAAPFDPDPRLAGGPVEGNQARSTLAFFRFPGELGRRWPELSLVERRRLAFLLYPLSGGLSRRPLVPAWAWRPLGRPGATAAARSRGCSRSAASSFWKRTAHVASPATHGGASSPT
jgi:SAM-dependent methyltransferase